MAQTFAWKVMLCLALAVFSLVGSAAAQFKYILKEEEVPKYKLPRVYRFSWCGNTTPEEEQFAWEKFDRPKLLKQFEHYIYGAAPKSGWRLTHRVVEKGTTATYRRLQYQMTIAFGKDTTTWDVALFLPKGVKPKGIFVGLNFYGNHTVISDPAIRIPYHYTDYNAAYLITGDRPTAASRGVRNHRWPILNIVKQGYGVATICYQDIEPDTPQLPKGWKPYGVRHLSKSDSLGAIGAWAWGLRRVVDVLQSTPEVAKGTPLYAVGHSRNGKAALWAAAQDTRFAGALVNGSGRGGASLYRRQFGEPLAEMIYKFPHWLSPAAKQFVQDPNTLPVDNHQLMALVAPRYLMICSATQDVMADPFGEFMSLTEASTAWGLYGKAWPNETAWPAPNQMVAGPRQAYHIRQGTHDITYLEWQRFMDWLDNPPAPAK